MLSAAIKLTILSVIMLNAIMLVAVTPYQFSVSADLCQKNSNNQYQYQYRHLALWL
jgi:hypothetical protein